MIEIKIAMPCVRCGTETEIIKDMAGNIAGVECPKCADKLEGLSNCMHTYGFDDIDEFISAIITNNLPTREQYIVNNQAKFAQELSKTLKELLEEVELHARQTCISPKCIEEALDILEEYEKAVQ